MIGWMAGFTTGCHTGTPRNTDTCTHKTQCTYAHPCIKIKILVRQGFAVRIAVPFLVAITLNQPAPPTVVFRLGLHLDDPSIMEVPIVGCNGVWQPTRAVYQMKMNCL